MASAKLVPRHDQRRAKRYSAAAKEYELGLDGLKNLERVPPDEHPFVDEATGTEGQESAQNLENLRHELQVTLLSNRAEAFLRCVPARLAEAASSCRAALAIAPSNEKAQRRLERAMNGDVGATSPPSSPARGAGATSGPTTASCAAARQEQYLNMPTWKLLLLRTWRDFRYGGPWGMGLVPWLKTVDKQVRWREDCVFARSALSDAFCCHSGSLTRMLTPVFSFMLIRSGSRCSCH